jgi:hypothetical protein
MLRFYLILCPSALFLLRLGRGRRSFAHDQQNRVLDHGFADQACGGEVHDRDDIVPREGAGEGGLVEDVGGNQRTGDEAAVAGGKIIENDRMIAGCRQRPAAMRADIARATGDQNWPGDRSSRPHGVRSLLEERLLLNSK